MTSVCTNIFVVSWTHTQTPNTRNSNTEGLICWSLQYKYTAETMSGS